MTVCHFVEERLSWGKNAATNEIVLVKLAFSINLGGVHQLWAIVQHHNIAVAKACDLPIQCSPTALGYDAMRQDLLPTQALGGRFKRACKKRLPTGRQIKTANRQGHN